MTRPLFSKSGEELQSFAKRNWDDRAELSLVLSELKRRDTRLAKSLQSEVEAQISMLDGSAVKSPMSGRRQEHFRNWG